MHGSYLAGKWEETCRTYPVRDIVNIEAYYNADGIPSLEIQTLSKTYYLGNNEPGTKPNYSVINFFPKELGMTPFGLHISVA